LDVAGKEGRSLLTETQYEHIRRQFLEMSAESDPRKSALSDVRGIENYFELRDKGGVLGKLNVRVYFAVIERSKTIAVLGCYKKEAEDKTPQYIKARMRNRLRFVLNELMEKGC